MNNLLVSTKCDPQQQRLIKGIGWSKHLLKGSNSISPHTIFSANMAEYESILCVKPLVHVYRIPPRPSNRGYRASDWKLDQPDWTGRLRVVAKGKELAIKLEDKVSGELFAKCPVEEYPGIAVEAVMDSSRYFVLRIKDDGGRAAFIGIGFEDRGDSFDLNVAIQDHFKHIRQEKEAEKSEAELQKAPKLDLGFKEGQTIRINISTKKSQEAENTTKRPKPRSVGGGGLGILPPPPAGTGGSILPPPVGVKQPGSGVAGVSQPAVQQTVPNSSANSNVDLLFDLGPSSTSSASQGQGQGQGQMSAPGFDTDFDLLSTNSDSKQTLPPAQPVGGSDPWGEFASASSANDSNVDWVQF